MTQTKSANSWFFVNPHDPGFGEYTEADERMHREANAEVADPASTETHYLPFSSPEHNVHSVNYLWLHPKVGSASGGVWTWRGMKPSQLHSEIFDVRDHMPIEVVGDMDSYELPNGYSVEVVKPAEEIRVSYEDPERDSAFDVTLTAIMPPAMLANGRHFEQGMRTRGSLRLRGEDIQVDGFALRDKSWGEARPEDPLQLPPVHWITCFFHEDFAVHVVAMEDPDHEPLWTQALEFSKERVDASGRGWVWRDGELTGLAEISLRTDWDRSTGYPTGHLIEIVDTNGKPYSLTSRTTGASRWYTWSNGFFPVTYMRYECEGRVGSGETQTGCWTDFVRLLDA